MSIDTSFNSKNTLGTYIKKASKDASEKSSDAVHQYHSDTDDEKAFDTMDYDLWVETHGFGGLYEDPVKKFYVNFKEESQYIIE